MNEKAKKVAESTKKFASSPAVKTVVTVVVSMAVGFACGAYYGQHMQIAQSVASTEVNS